jgi:hypothetical protein
MRTLDSLKHSKDRPILTALKCVLVTSAWIVGNLNTAATLVCILEEVHVGTFIESVVLRRYFCTRVKVMDISEAVQSVSQTTLLLEGTASLTEWLHSLLLAVLPLQ